MTFFRDLYSQLHQLPRTVRLFYVSDIFFAFSQAIFVTLFNLHLLKVGYNAEHIGRLQSLSALLMALAAVPVGVVADRIGRRWFYVAGSLLFGIPYAIMPVLTDFRPLMAAFGVHTLGMALMMVNESPLLAGEVGPDKRASVFSFMMINFFLWNTLGIQLAGFLSRWLPPGDLSEYLWPLVLAACCAVIAGIIRAFLPFRPYTPARQGLRILPSRTALLLALVSVLSGSSMVLMQSFSNVVFAERFAFGSATIATVMTVGGVLGWVASLFVPWTSSWLGELRGYALVVSLQGLLLLYLGMAATPATFLPGFWMRTILQNMQMPLFSAFSMGVTVDAERATANSYAMVGRNLGAGIAAGWLGMVLAEGNYLLAFAGAGLAALATAGMTLFAFRGAGGHCPADLQT